MQGGKKGLIVNSRDLCRHPSRAAIELTAHNAKRYKPTPVVRAVDCKKKRKKGAKRR